jgi:hypothetical protein
MRVPTDEKSKSTNGPMCNGGVSESDDEEEVTTTNKRMSSPC